MKLKYYMRGLGIGIILTTLIIAIGNPKKEISDQEIKKRAEALGMEMKEENNENLEDILASAGPTKAAEPTEKPQVTKAPTVTPVPSPTITPEPTPTAAPTPKPTPTTIPVPTKEPQKEEGAAAGKITFSIEKGMSSNMVSKMLVTKGLISDSEDFNQYIVNVGKASVIRVGTYTVPEGASYEEIVKVITTRQ
jgi:cell division septation protein DedD